MRAHVRRLLPVRAATGSQAPGPHGAVGRVDDRVHGEAVAERLARRDAVAERVHEVAHHRVVAVGVGLVRDREDPARVGVHLLAEIAGRSLDERAQRRGRDVLDDPPGIAVGLEAVLEAALRRPRDVHGGDPVVLEAHEHDRVVLEGRLVGVDEGRAPGEHVAHGDVLAEEVAGGFGAVRAHVQQRAATGQLGIPEVRGVRAAVALARPERRQPPDRAGLDHLVHPDRLDGEDDVLHVQVVDAGRLDQADHLGRLDRVAPERLGAGDALAVPGRQPDRLDVEVVRQRHDDEIDLRIGADGLHRVQRTAAEPSGERLAALRPGAPVGGDVDARHVAQAERVELADEPGPQEPDADLACHQ